MRLKHFTEVLTNSSLTQTRINIVCSWRSLTQQSNSQNELNKQESNFIGIAVLVSEWFISAEI